MNRLFASRNILRRFIAETASFRLRTVPKFVNYPNIFFTSFSFVKGSYQPDPMENFDLKLQQACEKGEAAVVELMDVVNKQMNEIAKSYKKCLEKQIELIDKATKAGATSPKWDELPEFRTLARELSDQFQSFVVTINTIGEIAENETLKYITQQEKLFKLIAKKHKELEKTLQKQIADIKKLEEKVLAKTRDSIQKAK